MGQSQSASDIGNNEREGHFLPAVTPTTLHRGLQNEAGENNCFLNVTIQALWHVGPFRVELQRLLLSPDAAQRGELIQTLNSLFTQYEFAELSVLPPTQLRLLLANLCSKFELGEIADSNEALEAILSSIHSETSSSCPGPNQCLAHRVFGGEVIEQFVCSGDQPDGSPRNMQSETRACGCGASSEPSVMTNFTHCIYVQQAIQSVESAQSRQISSRSSNGSKFSSHRYFHRNSYNNSKTEVQSKLIGYNSTPTNGKNGNTNNSNNNNGNNELPSNLIPFGQLIRAAMNSNHRCPSIVDDTSESNNSNNSNNSSRRNSRNRSSNRFEGGTSSSNSNRTSTTGEDRQNSSVDAYTASLLNASSASSARLSMSSQSPSVSASSSASSAVAPCPYMANSKRYCLTPPLALAITVVWTQAREERKTIQQFLSIISYTIKLSDLFDNNNSGGINNTNSRNGDDSDVRYVFRGLVCYYGLHYVSIIQEYSPGEPRFLLFDDSRIRIIGNWSDVKNECIASNYQPVLLLYEIEGKENYDETLNTNGVNNVNNVQRPHSRRVANYCYSPMWEDDVLVPPLSTINNMNKGDVAIGTVVAVDNVTGNNNSSNSNSNSIRVNRSNSNRSMSSNNSGSSRGYQIPAHLSRSMSIDFVDDSYHYMDAVKDSDEVIDVNERSRNNGYKHDSKGSHGSRHRSNSGNSNHNDPHYEDLTIAPGKHITTLQNNNNNNNTRNESKNRHSNEKGVAPQRSLDLIEFDENSADQQAQRQNSNQRKSDGKEVPQQQSFDLLEFFNTNISGIACGAGGDAASEKGDEHRIASPVVSSKSSTALPTRDNNSNYNNKNISVDKNFSSTTASLLTGIIPADPTNNSSNNYSYDNNGNKILRRIVDWYVKPMQQEVVLSADDDDSPYFDNRSNNSRTKHKSLGIAIDVDDAGNVVIVGFRRHPITDQPLPAELSGKIELMDRVIAINNDILPRVELSTCHNTGPFILDSNNRNSVRLDELTRKQCIQTVASVITATPSPITFLLQSAYKTQISGLCPYCCNDIVISTEVHQNFLAASKLPTSPHVGEEICLPLLCLSCLNNCLANVSDYLTCYHK